MEETHIRVDVPRTKRTLIPQETAAPAQPAATPKGRAKGGWRRLARWTVGIALLGEAAWLLAPTMLFRTSLSATTTAPLAVVRIPQQGLLEGSPPPVGTVVVAGQKLFDVQTATRDLRPVERIRGEIESIRKTSAAMKAQIAEMEAVKAELRGHFAVYREARIAQVEKQATEHQARVKAAESRLKSAEFEHRMYQRLSNRGASSELERARAEYALEEARNGLEVARQAASRCQLQLEAARRGIFVGEADGGQDRVASRQRCDEIELQQSALRARLGELEGHLEELQARLSSEERYLAESRLPVLAPISGVIWSSTLKPGSEVSAGSVALEIVDASKLSLEAVFRKADAERVYPGRAVKVRLLGSSQVLEGQVLRVSDLDAFDQQTVTVNPHGSLPPHSFRAIIRLKDQPAGGTAENDYHIGTSAVVWMTR
jgi:multidrug resistance efflux pump